MSGAGRGLHVSAYHFNVDNSNKYSWNQSKMNVTFSDIFCFTIERYRIASGYFSWIHTILVIRGKIFMLCIATLTTPPFVSAASIKLEGTACAKGPLGLGKLSFLLKYRYKAISKCFCTCSGRLEVSNDHD